MFFKVLTRVGLAAGLGAGVIAAGRKHDPDFAKNLSTESLNNQYQQVKNRGAEFLQAQSDANAGKVIDAAKAEGYTSNQRIEQTQILGVVNKCDYQADRAKSWSGYITGEKASASSMTRVSLFGIRLYQSASYDERDPSAARRPGSK